MINNEVRIVPDYKGNEVMEYNGQSFAIVTNEYVAKSVITNYDDKETTDELYDRIDDMQDQINDLEDDYAELESDLKDIQRLLFNFKKDKLSLKSDYVELVDKIRKIVGQR